MNKTIFRVVIVLFFAAVFLLLVNTNMRKGLSHDEHMYIAAGQLLANGAMLPYRDYPYLQMPNLALIYAPLFMVTDDLLLAARLLNTIVATLMLLAIFYFAADLLRPSGKAMHFLVGAGSALLVLSNPIFIYTSGLAWNHDLPLLLTVMAAIIYSRVLDTQISAKRLILCGLLVGLAVGTRISFAPTVIPFAMGIFMLRGEVVTRRLSLLGVFSAGALLGLLPAIVLAALAPARFAFDNWDYHQINAAYWQQSGYDRAMTLWGKLAYLKDVAAEPGNLVLLTMFIVAALVVAVRAWQRKQWSYSPFVFITTLAASLLLGALAPTPTWYQYYYALVPFMVLGIVYALGSVYACERARKWSLGLFGVAVSLCVLFSFPTYLQLNNNPSWVPSEAHHVGTEIKQAVPHGKVATLAPLFPMEGGVPIYEELATGPFEWRVAGLIPDRQKSNLNIISPATLDKFLAADPPAAILVGFEGDLEQSLIDYAKKHGYRPSTLSNGATLWRLP